jgi:toxin ParE1/3/4
MASRRYKLSRRARTDLDSISDYLGERSPESARRVLTELRNAFEYLAKNPEAGTSRDDLRPGVRFYAPPRPARNCMVVYYRQAEGVEISDVIHAARDWEGLFARGER